MLEKYFNFKNIYSVEQTVELIDSVSDTALIGAGTNPTARRLIVAGSLLSGVGAIGLLLASTITALEAGAAVTVLFGVTSLFKGLLLGYKSGKALNSSREDSIAKLNHILETSEEDTKKLANILKSILIIPNTQNAV